MLVAADVSQEDDVERMFKEVLAEYGRVDFLVNNAGIQFAADTHELPVDSFDKVLAVNLRARSCAPDRRFATWSTRSARGRSSTCRASIRRSPGRATSRLGEQGRDAEPHPHPGAGVRRQGHPRQRDRARATVTPINRSSVDDPEKRAMVVEHIPMNRAGESWEMAAATSFLLSDEAAYITGQTLFVDGGLTLFADFRTTWSSE